MQSVCSYSTVRCKACRHLKETRVVRDLLCKRLLPNTFSVLFTCRIFQFFSVPIADCDFETDTCGWTDNSWQRTSGPSAGVSENTGPSNGHSGNQAGTVLCPLSVEVQWSFYFEESRPVEACLIKVFILSGMNWYQSRIYSRLNVVQEYIDNTE